jgi:hypothetical protein
MVMVVVMIMVTKYSPRQALPTSCHVASKTALWCRNWYYRHLTEAEREMIIQLKLRHSDFR